MSAAPRVVVTGAAGFIGTHVCAHLAAAGFPVRALVRPHQHVPDVQLAFAADLHDRAGIQRALSGMDAVVHLAARVHVTRAAATDSAEAYERVNVDGTRALLMDALAAGARHFILASSVKVMGEANTAPWPEDALPAPAEPYGASKLRAEETVRELVAGTGARADIVRLPLVYGPGNRANMLRLFQLVDRGVPLPLGGIANRRSLAYVGNVAAALELLLRSPAAGARTWYVSDGEDVSTPELVIRIARALGRPPRLVPAPARLLRACARMGDALDRVVPVPLTSAAVHRLFSSLVVDSRPLWRLRGGSPPWSLAEGLAETAAWYRQPRTHAAA